MSRQLRIEIEHGIYHVTARGWERRVLVRDDRDREKWFTLLDRVVDRFGWPNIPELKYLAWRPSREQIELTVAEEFGVDVSDLYAKRLRNNEARVAALYLIRKLTSVPAIQLARQYGGVSQAAISKTVSRAEARRDEERRWKQMLSRLEKSLRSRNDFA